VEAVERCLPIDTALLTLSLVPLVVILVWWSLRRVAGRLSDE
jgi:uncharacterized membrane-anchored protein